jgi:hypothetical protein
MIGIERLQTHIHKEPDMASSTKQQTVPQPKNDTEVPIEVPQDPISTAPLAPTTKSAFEHFREYERERPGVVALWCLGIGFVLGWKLKLW